MKTQGEFGTASEEDMQRNDALRIDLNKDDTVLAIGVVPIGLRMAFAPGMRVRREEGAKFGSIEGTLFVFRNDHLDHPELWDDLSGFHMYDEGFTDAGLHDNRLKQRRFDEIKAMDDDDFLKSLTRYFRESYFTEEAMRDGFTVEDAQGFIKWLADQGVWEF